MMESMPMYNESFSYSWVLHLRPSSFDAKDPHSRNLSVDSIDDGPFIEIDLKKMTPVLIATTTTATHDRDESSDFDFPVTTQPPSLVPADRLFVNGRLLPMHHFTTHHHEETATQPRCRQNFLRWCGKSLHRFLRHLQPCGKSGRKNSRSQVAAVNSEVGYGVMDSSHRMSVDDGTMGSRRSFGVLANLSLCSSCPTTPRHESRA